MEILGLFILYVIIKFIFNSSRKDSRRKEVSNKLEEGINIKVTQKKEKIEGVREEIEIFNIKGKGVLYSNLNDNRIAYLVTMLDATEELLPIYSTLESMQWFEGLFGLKSDFFQLPYNISEINTWVDIFDIPIDVLVFPRKGQRKIKVELSIINSSSKVINKSHKIISYENKKIGYQDAKEYANKIKRYSVNFAMHAAFIDGEITKDEAGIIKQWILKKFDDSELENNKIFDIINESLEEAKKMKEKSYINHIYNDINSIATNKDKYEMLELVLSVTAGDSKFDKDEESLLEEMCSQLEIKREVYNNMASKIISVNIREDLSNVNKMLGIKESMSKNEKNKILKKKYREWSSRVNHKDKKIRDQAENMLQLIAEEKKKIRKY